MLLYPERRSKILFVGLTHLVLTCYGLLITIFDIINEQYPFSVYELAIVLVHYLGHSLLIYLLFLGFKYNLPLLYLPWLSIFLGVFATVSFLWLESLAKATTNLNVLPFFGNLGVLGLVFFLLRKKNVFKINDIPSTSSLSFKLRFMLAQLDDGS
ncbi:uncharacterized protein LOC126741188 isoform X1 [Anthonomus grandis grandis]|uniref:uncharacterized protein LOC126741188 isoform X1 n=1 Tax=Anthonomus grandis grandis TaxID=2921223 RepID=UPI0021655969|nr:uncharacterized protein LOC126741188 isoform X1 [Anthonomus grandis grandis]